MRALIPHGSSRQRGYSLVEVLVALSVVAVAMLIMLQQLTLSYRETGSNQLRVFAYQRAIAMLAELQAGIERGSIPDTDALDKYADHGTPNYVLTTLVKGETAVPPEHPMSANVARDGGWTWFRLIDIDRVPSQDRMRFVRVRVVHVDVQGRGETLAVVTGILIAPAKPYPPAQVHDVYMVSIAEAPSLWQTTAALRNLIEAARADLRASTQNLDFQFHWITKLGYGRDQAYTPFVNGIDLATATTPWAYWYPGLVGNGTEHDVLYSHDLLSGRAKTEEGLINDWDPTRNAVPHAVADRWNHCMRYPDAKALFDQRVAVGLEDPAAPPLQILLEDLNQNPAKYRNAIFVDLHGTALPVPPLRNYSDPAKDERSRVGVRAVTHAAKLRPARDPNGDGNHADTEDCEFRVYAYRASAQDTGPATVDAITLEIPGINVAHNVNGVDSFSATTLLIRQLAGGVDWTTGERSVAAAYVGFEDPAGVPAMAASALYPYRPWCEVTYAGGSTWIVLHNTPLVAPEVAGQGLPVAQRLFGYEYVPSPVGSAAGFATDLATSGTGPKNTARWRIRIPRTAFQSGFPGGSWSNVDRLVTVRTRLGIHTSGTRAGTMWPPSLREKPQNKSSTYAWWARTPEAVPLTERFQMQGDPRLNPYLDLCMGGSSWPDGYNWYFQDLKHAGVDATLEYPCLNPALLHDGYGAGVFVDVPRAFSLWRIALFKARGILTFACGAVAEDLLMGGEIALPPAVPGGSVTPVTVSGRWFGLGGTAQVDTVTPNSLLAAAPGGAAPIFRGQHMLISGDGSSFWVKEWLGELFPPEAIDAWEQHGNVGCGVAAGQLVRALRDAEPNGADTRGTSFVAAAGSAVGVIGAATFFQSGSPMIRQSIVHYALPQASGILQLNASGDDIGRAARVTWTPSVTGTRPFRMDADLALPDAELPPHLVAASSLVYPPCQVKVLETPPLYSGPDVGGKATIGAALLKFYPPTTAGGLGSAFAAVLSMTPANDAEQKELFANVLVFPLRALHDAGLESTATDPAVDQLPRAQIVLPQESSVFDKPKKITVRWRTSWLRFDGLQYTPAYSADASVPSSYASWEQRLQYVVLYSTDNGSNWKYAQNGSMATPLTRPTSSTVLLSDQVSGDESYVVDTDAAEFPAGEVLFRVEMFSSLRQAHVSCHQVKVSILR